MMNKGNIIILDNLTSIRFRVKKILNSYNIDVYEAENSKELFKLMKTLEKNISLIVMDINLKNEDGFNVLSEIKAIDKNVPVVILTADSSREMVFQGIVKGAADYILKPFDKETIENKTMKYLTQNTHKKDKGLRIDLNHYLSGEIKRSRKGRYDVSIVLLTFRKSVIRFTAAVENEYLLLNDYIYRHLNEEIWDTDAFFNYGSQVFIGVFPFCGKESVGLVEAKFQKKFESLKTRKAEMEDYELVMTSITIPEDGTEVEPILEDIARKIKKEHDRERGL